ncbi:MAG: hypothetical protein IPM82_30370 [Saprospiraceae bacterium]|nr:hypothetical protein [Saprospiraceae bacterium]
MAIRLFQTQRAPASTQDFPVNIFPSFIVTTSLLGACAEAELADGHEQQQEQK